MSEYKTILNGLNLGQMIKKRRQELQLTQDEFGKRIDKGRSSITFIETRGNDITLELLIRIASALECDLTYFLKPSQYAWNSPVAVATPIEDTKMIEQLNSKEYVEDLDPLSKDFYYSFIHKLDTRVKDHAKRDAVSEVLTDLETFIHFKMQTESNISLSDNLLKEFKRYREASDDARYYAAKHL